MRKPFVTHKAARKGFTFIEVLFAVILLGIGFIMIAGIFPVAIQETQATANETQGMLLCRSALQQIQGSSLGVIYASGGTGLALGATGSASMQSMTNSENVSTSVFFTENRIYCWQAFYYRPTSAPTAQLFIIALRNPYFINGYSSGGQLYSNPPLANSGIVKAINYNSPATGYSTIDFGATSSTTIASWIPALATGTYIFVLGDTGASPHTSLTGSIFRLGANLSTSTEVEYELQPGWDLQNLNQATTTSNSVTIAFYGRAGNAYHNSLYNSSTNPLGSTEWGPVMDCAVLSAYIPAINNQN